MVTVLPALLVALAVTAAVLPWVRRRMERAGVVDAPDARRKLHGRTVPLGGGLAVFAGWAAALFVLALLGRAAGLVPPDAAGWVGGWGHPWAGAEGTRLVGLIAGAGLLVVAGLYDDARDLRGRQKLVVQVLAALVLCVTGTVVRRVGVFGAVWELGPLAVPFTVCWLVGAVNAVNLLDGVDGLAGTVGIILGTAFCCMALLTPAGPGTAAVAAALVGALLAFLHANFPPARIFLGDAGSMTIGLVLGWVAVHSNFKGAATMALTAPAAVWAVPLFDVGMAILRRKLTGRSLYTTDRGHLHHRLAGELNLSGPRVLLVVAGLCAVTGASAVAGVALGREWPAAVGAAVVLVGMVVTRLFGSREVDLLARRAASTARSLVPGSARRRTRDARATPDAPTAPPDVVTPGPVTPGGRLRAAAAGRFAGLGRLRLPVPEPLTRPTRAGLPSLPGVTAGGGRSGPAGRAGRQQVSRLRGEHAWEDLWDELLDGTEGFGLRSLHLDVNHPALKEDFVATWRADGPAADALRLWKMDLPVVGAAGPVGWLRVSAELPTPGPGGATAADRLATLLAILAVFERKLVEELDHHLPRARSAAETAAEEVAAETADTRAAESGREATPAGRPRRPAARPLPGFLTRTPADAAA